MRYGANTLIWAESFGPAQFSILPRVKSAGLDGVEIPIFHPAGLQSAEVRRELERMELACTACTVMPPGLSLGDADPQIRAQARTHVCDCIHAAAEAGVSLLAGPIYTPVGFFTGHRRSADEWQRTIESWRELTPVVEAVGLQIAIEALNRFETYFLNTVDDAAALCDAIDSPHIGILIDTFHANIEEKSIGAALRRAGRHLKHLHTCENDRGTPGTGNVNWPEFFTAVRDLGYNGWLTIESFGFSLGEIAAAASIWRDLAPTPESIAFEGVKFLRANTQPS
jgi:D-psicose/D-tagatose/L-ribulose 3-epimerase